MLRRLALALAASAALHLLALAALGTLPEGGPLATAGRFLPRLSVFLPPAGPAPRPADPGAEGLDSGWQTGRAAPQAAAIRQARGLRPAAVYYPARELDRRPQIRVQVEPEFPALALVPEGRVVLSLYLSETGEVDDIAVESADATGAFEAAARRAFGAARFYPGVKDGVPVKSRVRIEVRFGLPPPPRATLSPP